MTKQDGKHLDLMTENEINYHYSTYPKDGVSSPLDSFVVTKSSVLKVGPQLALVFSLVQPPKVPKLFL